jgi:hypothetical protein
MTHNWKPGDVMDIDGFIGVYGGDDRFHRPGWPPCDVTSISGRRARPLVVIDPENREQIERLADVFCHSPSSGWVDQMQAALRSLLEPEPEEPAVWLAVVRDGNGDEWYRWADHEDVNPWGHRQRIRNDRAWPDLPRPITVLSEGWQEATDD